MDAYLAGLDRWPGDDPRLYLLAGVALAGAGDRGRAEGCLRRILEFCWDSQTLTGTDPGDWALRAGENLARIRPMTATHGHAAADRLIAGATSSRKHREPGQRRSRLP